MRVRPLWLWRVALGGFALAYLASDTLQTWVPPLLPFLAAVAVEAQFFVSGLRAGDRVPPGRDAGPQPHDLAELGWPGEEDGDLEPTDAGPSPAAGRRPRRALRHLLAAVVVLALLAAAVFLDTRAAHWQRLSHADRAATVALLERQAARIAGHPATVVCDVRARHVGSVQDADGLAEVGGGRMWLTPQICYSLHRVMRTHRAARGSGHALAVLAHESWHLQGVADEGVANCYAYQSGVAVGEAFGLGAATARSLMHRELAQNPSDFADDPAYVVPAGCRRGGSLDLHLDGRRFP